MTPLYVFDIDGTLLRADGAGGRAFDRALGDVFDLAGAGVGIRFGGKTDPIILDEILVQARQRAATTAERARFYASYLPALDDELTRSAGFRVLPGAVTALDHLADRGLQVGIGTGNIEAGAQAKLRRAGLHTRFAFGGYASDAAPRAELIGIAIARGRAALGANAAPIIVGDTVHDVAAAHACGGRVVAVTTGADDEATLRAVMRPGDVLLASLAELPAWHDAHA